MATSSAFINERATHGETTAASPRDFSYSQIIADRLSKSGWSWGLGLNRGFLRANNLRC
jgi:hypothetical protein